jgi:hypothetical protein
MLETTAAARATRTAIRDATERRIWPAVFPTNLRVL